MLKVHNHKFFLFVQTSFLFTYLSEVQTINWMLKRMGKS